MKKIKYIFLILLATLCLLTLTACSSNDNKAKVGYDIWKKTMVDTWGNDVEFKHADFVKVENGNSDVYYYKAQFTVYTQGTDAQDITYFKWFLGTNQVLTLTEDVYKLAYSSIENNEMDGLLGRVK